MAREKIKSLRKSRDLSQAALGRLVNLTASEISRIECGYRDMDSVETLAIASALRVSPGEISDAPVEPKDKVQAVESAAPPPAEPVPESRKVAAVSVTVAPEKKPVPVGSDLSDPTNFGVLPDLQLLEQCAQDGVAFHTRLSGEIARAKVILHTSRVPAAVWRAWREFEKKATERLQRPAGLAISSPPTLPVEVPASPAREPANADSSALAESKSFNALFVEAARRLLPADLVERLNRAAEASRQADPSIGFMKRFRMHAETEISPSLLEQVKAEAHRQTVSPARARARRGRA